MVTRVIGFRRRESESLCRAGRRWSVVAPRDPSESMAGRRRATLPARGRRQRGRVASGPRWAAAVGGVGAWAVSGAEGRGRIGAEVRWKRTEAVFWGNRGRARFLTGRARGGVYSR